MTLVHGFATVDGDQTHAKWIAETGALAHDFWAMERLLPLVPVGGTVLDIGANIGTHTCEYLRKVGPTGRVIAIEPNPAAFSCLEYNCPAAECILAAAGARNGLAQLCPDKSNVGATFCQEGDGDVHVLAIDDLHLPACHYIKIDVEGWEPAVLRGAAHTVEKYRPTLVVEVNRGALHRAGFTAEELIKIIEGHDYAWRSLQNETGEQWDLVGIWAGPA